MKARPDDVYIARMWKQTLLTDLTWRRDDPNPVVSSKGPRPNKTSPTWSWASAKGPIEFSCRLLVDDTQVMDVTFTPFGPAQIGRCREYHIESLEVVSNSSPPQKAKLPPNIECDIIPDLEFLCDLEPKTRLQSNRCLDAYVWMGQHRMHGYCSSSRVGDPIRANRSKFLFSRTEIGGIQPEIGCLSGHPASRRGHHCVGPI